MHSEGEQYLSLFRVYANETRCLLTVGRFAAGRLHF